MWEEFFLILDDEEFLLVFSDNEELSLSEFMDEKDFVDYIDGFSCFFVVDEFLSNKVCCFENDLCIMCK